MSDNSQVSLKVADADLGDVFGDLARFHLDHRSGWKAGKIVLLTVGSQNAYAVARGLKRGQAKEEISLDSSLRERLSVKPNQVYAFRVRAAGFLGEAIWAWNSTDPVPRVAARLGAISVVLGGIGFLLGIISLCKG